MTKQIKLTSPNGKAEVLCCPDRVEYMLSNGWTKPAKTKPAKAVTEKGDK